MIYTILIILFLNFKCSESSSNEDYVSKFGLKKYRENLPLHHYKFYSNVRTSYRHVSKRLEKNELKEKKYNKMNFTNNSIIMKRYADPVFHGHPKTQEEKWHEMFLSQTKGFDQNPSLIKLIHNITLTYLNECTPVILYDDQIKSHEGYLFQDLFKTFPVTFIHGYIGEKYILKEPRLLEPKYNCFHFIVFLNDVKSSAKVLGKQSKSKVIVVARSSQWAVQEFLSGPLSRFFVNLVVIGQSFKEEDNSETAYILYTHILYTDGLGASKPQVLCSWSHGKFSRQVNLFPTKMIDGYAGHRFIVVAANQPPFIFRRIHTDGDGGNPAVIWDGLEIRILKLLADRNNFSIEITEPRDGVELGAGDAVTNEITSARADIGVAGMYVTSERSRDMDMSFSHSHDCAAFITLTSTALPRYRAILGPFHWHVWVALTFTYLIGIFPLAFSDKHTLRHLLHDKGEIENMFWYVFGTFTNCFTFVGENSWSKTTKITTRLLIGWYWVFTIIITSCYTGSIIAFVTLPIFPETVDTIKQLLSGFYRVGTLDRGGWERWFFNSSDPLTNKLLKKIEFVPDVRVGIRNTTEAFFFPYAFLGSRAELQYIVQSNFSKTESKRSVLHISNECFVPFGVGIAFPNNSLYGAKLSDDIRRMMQAGILDKLNDEVRWAIQRSTSGTLLPKMTYNLCIDDITLRTFQSYIAMDEWFIKVVYTDNLKKNTIEEKGLTLEDTQGMFLLLGAGFLIAGTALLSEWMGGFSKKCRMIGRKMRSSKISHENLIDSPKKTMDELNKGSQSRLRYKSRSTISNDSDDTLEGEIINVTHESITVHNDFNVYHCDSRRSSSVDLDREVEVIFKKETQRRRAAIEEEISDSVVKRTNTASKDAFGEHVHAN